MPVDTGFEIFAIISWGKMERFSPAPLIKLCDQRIKIIGNILGFILPFSVIFFVKYLIVFGRFLLLCINFHFFAFIKLPAPAPKGIFQRSLLSAFLSEDSL